MKKFVVLTIALCFVAGLAFAQASTETKAAAPESATITLKGTIIDNNCAGSQKPEALADFVKTHTKDCATMPDCAASGYSIYADSKLTKFDKDNSAKVEQFLKKPDSKLDVNVVANKVSEELSLVSIENQK